MTNESPKPNQVRRVTLGDEFLVELFSERSRVVNGLPEDAEFIRLIEDPPTMSYELLFRSAKFSPVEEAEEIPRYEIEFEEIPTFRTAGYRVNEHAE